MSDTNFTDYVTPVPAAWLNDINDHVYNNTPISPATTVHPASVIANTPAGTIAATTVQAAINELDTEKLAISAIGTSVPSPTGTGASGTWGISITGNAATASDAAAHIADTVAAHTASAISNTPAGNIAATDVQAAINELDAEKAALSGATFTGAITQSVVGAVTRISLHHYRNAAASPNAGFTINSSRGDGVTASAVQNGDTLGYFMAGGDNGTSLTANKANITMYAAENWTATANGTALALSTTPIGSTTLTERMRIDNAGLVTAAGGLQITGVNLLGYGTGAGGTVTQTTSKSTAVTLNKPCGQITMNNAALAAGGTVRFALNNTLIVSGDIVMAQPYGGFAAYGCYDVWAENPASGGVQIHVKNISAGSLSEGLIITFQVYKGATS